MVTVGIDEVGRGCWAGPLVAGAVVIDRPIAGLKDSKKLTQRRRQDLSDSIRAQAVAFGLGWVSPAEIDALGLTEAVRLAMRRALDGITVDYDEIIIDGSYNFLVHEPRARAVVKADASIAAVSAASIIAKVARDAYMTQLANQPGYRQYGFERHVGYGTALHADRLRLHGVCDQHRRSYKPVKAICYNA